MQKTAKDGALSYNPCTWSLRQEDCHQSKTVWDWQWAPGQLGLGWGLVSNTEEKNTEMWTVENGSNNVYAMEKDKRAN